MVLKAGKYLFHYDVNQIIQNTSSYASSHGITLTSIDTVKNNANLMNLITTVWHL